MPACILIMFCVSLTAILFSTYLIIVQSIFSVPNKLFSKSVCVIDSNNDFKILLIKRMKKKSGEAIFLD